MKQSVLNTAIVLVALIAASTGCWSPADQGGEGGADTAHGNERSGAAEDATPTELESIGDPGSDVSPYGVSYGSATAAGTNLVVLESTFRAGDQLSAALRREDGSWWQLPALPFTGYIQLSSADDRAVAGGIACTDDACTEREGRLAFAMLSEDHTQWERLDAPDVPLPVADTELTTTPAMSLYAGFQVGDRSFLVNADGEVTAPVTGPIPPADAPEVSASDIACTVGDEYLRMHTAFPAPPDVVVGVQPVLIGQVYAQPADGSGDPQPVAPVEPDFAVALGSLCSGSALTVLGEESAADFDVASRTWSVSPSNFADFDTSISSITGWFAIAPDCSTVFVVDPDLEQRVITRSGTGLWEDTDTRGHIFATGSQVLAIGEDRSVTRVWPD